MYPIFSKYYLFYLGFFDEDAREGTMDYKLHYCLKYLICWLKSLDYIYIHRKKKQ